MELVAPGQACHQKRVVEFGDWLCREVVKAVPHRHVVFSIPKILRRYFLYDRKLLSELSRCGWEALKAFYTTGVRDPKARPGAVVAIQTFGDFLGFHPHLHILVSDGCFHENGMFSVFPAVNTKFLEQIFRHNVFKMLLSKGKITQELVDMLMSWPPARRAYASESAIRDSTFIVDQGFNRVMTRLWPPARRAYASERKPGPVYHPGLPVPPAFRLKAGILPGADDIFP